MALPAESQWARLHLSQWEATGQWHLCGCALTDAPARRYAHAPPWPLIPALEPSSLQPLNPPPTPALPLTTLPAAPRPGTCNLQCFNGGSCFLNARRQPKCRCQPRYTGDKCELDQCWEHCRNGGTCAASPSGMAFGSPARTPPGPWTLLPPSHLCPALLRLCCPPTCCPQPQHCCPLLPASQPCSPAVGPGGQWATVRLTRRLLPGMPTCRCPTGFTGPKCTQQVCAGYCANNSTCTVNQGNQPQCRCLPGFLGDRCQYRE